MGSIYTPYRPERYTIKKYLGKGKYGGHIFEVYKKLLEIRTKELLKYRDFTFSAISKAYMSNKSDKEFREWFKDEYDKQICSK